jgi:UDP-N-acetylmuramoylalanine--D-glutamate ligase
MMATAMQIQENNQPDPHFLSGRILIVGLGSTGLSCARFLSAKGAKDIAVTDSRSNPPGLEQLKNELPDIAVFVGGFEAEAFHQADSLIVSPGVSVNEPLINEARSRGCDVLGDIEIFARLVSAPVIAITGSNGKSTVTSLVYNMAREAGLNVAIGGNIGIPVLELVDDDVELYVLELSSFQLETTSSLNATAAVILNISEDHMDRYRDLSAYTAAKFRIYHGEGNLVINRDDEKVIGTETQITKDRRITGFTLHQPLNKDFGLCLQGGTTWLCQGGDALLAESALKIKGKHNTANVLAALALGYVMNFPMNTMLSAIKKFPGLEHRCQWIGNFNGVDWFNDSKATNVGAAVAAIEGLDAEKIVLIAGGQGKGQDFSLLRAAVEVSCRYVILFGEDAGLLKSALGDIVETIKVSSLEEAVTKAASLALTGDAVLLSPACASFDMFSGYAERGHCFVDAVKRLCL